MLDRTLTYGQRRYPSPRALVLLLATRLRGVGRCQPSLEDFLRIPSWVPV